MTIDEFTRRLGHLTDEQVNALDRYFTVATAYRKNIGECDEETFYISKCNCFDTCKNLGIPDEMMEV
jgi:hypothetical protein